MKRLIACLSLVAVATTAAVPATSLTQPPPAAKHVAKAPPKCKLAPADEYFGRLKMSILGIQNTIRDQGFKIDGDPQKASSTLGAIALTEDAIHDWQRKYRCDNWLPGTLYSLERFYLKIHTEDGVKRVHATYAWLRRDYPNSRFSLVAKRDDGLATATAAVFGPAPNAPPPSAAPAGTNGPAVPLGQAAATPIPGAAPQSVINAQIATPAPTKAPH